MFHTEIPQDIRKFKMKTVASLTMRQLICVIICIIVDLVLYTSVLKAMNLGARETMFAFFAADIVFLAIGFVEKMEMPLEKFLLMYIRCNVLSPLERKASGELDVKEEKKEKKKKALSRKELKKHPEYRAYK